MRALGMLPVLLVPSSEDWVTPKWLQTTDMTVLTAPGTSDTSCSENFLRYLVDESTGLHLRPLLQRRCSSRPPQYELPTEVLAVLPRAGWSSRPAQHEREFPVYAWLYQ